MQDEVCMCGLFAGLSGLPRVDVHLCERAGYMCSRIHFIHSSVCVLTEGRLSPLGALPRLQIVIDGMVLI